MYPYASITAPVEGRLARVSGPQHLCFARPSPIDSLPAASFHKLGRVLIISLIVSSLFLQLGDTYAESRTFFGASFLCVMFMAMGAMPQLSIAIATKSVWYKFRDNNFYPAYAHAIGGTLAVIPMAMVDCALFSLVTYFMIGFYMSAGHFFTFYVILVAISVNSAALFRMIAHIAPDGVSANAYGGFVLLILIIMSGFSIVRGSIPNYWIWAYYLSPFSWALRAVVINEMTSPAWQGPDPSDPSSSIGVTSLLSFDFFTETYWIWAGVGYLFASTFIWAYGSSLALARPPSAPATPDRDHTPTAPTRQATGSACGQYEATGSTQGGHSEGRHVMMEHLSQREQNACATGGQILEIGASLVGSGFHTMASGPLPCSRDVSSGGGVTASAMARNRSGSREMSNLGEAGAFAGARKHSAGLSVGADVSRGGGANVAMARKRSTGPSISLSVGDGFERISQRVGVQDGESAALGRQSGGTQSGGMSDVIPFQPVTLVFQDLRYFVPNPSYKGKSAAAKPAKADEESGPGPEEVPAELELLKGITGFAEPCMLMALMGGSGAGKTTLMDVIAGRKTVGRISGDIHVNGHLKEQRAWSRAMGYVEQMDIHTPAATVIEALVFSARLRLPRAVTDAQVKAYVEEVVGIVDLTENMFDLVGVPGSTGLSVEQRKRLTIALELVANPSVVFMDEPTSAQSQSRPCLSHASAHLHMHTYSCVFVCTPTQVTIHQPSIEIFETFDQLLLLQRGGRTTYFGPLGHQSMHLVSYLEAVPGVSRIHDGVNPATWMLEVTGGAVSVGTKAVQADWPTLYLSSELSSSNAEHAASLVRSQRTSHAPLAVSGLYAATFGVQVRMLWSKYQAAYWRTPSYNFTRFVTTTLVACVYASVYRSAGSLSSPASIATVQNVLGVIYSSISFIGMSNMMAVMPFLGYERVVYYREQASSMYNPWAFGFVTSSVETPYILAQVGLFVGIIYFVIGFQMDVASFFFFMLLQFESLLFYTSFGQALVYITPSQQLGQVVGSGLNFLFNVFNGFLFPYPTMPVYYKWANRGTPTTWLLYGLVTSQLGSQDIAFSYPADPSITTVPQFLERVFGWTYDFRFYCIAIVAAYIVFFRVIAVLALRYISFLRR
ncbi:MAG: hypothetical protein WDW38_003643 [Sanguina aurantia]